MARASSPCFGQAGSLSYHFLAGSRITDFVRQISLETPAQGGPLLDILLGSVGAFLVGLCLTPFFGMNMLKHGFISIPAMLVSSLGALFAVVLFHRFRHASR